MNQEDLKKEYEEITAPSSLKNKVQRTFRHQQYRQVLTRSVASAVAVLAIGVVALNFSPTLAVAAADIPGLAPLVRIVTFSRFAVKEHGYEANIVTPQITGLVDKELEAKLNNEFQHNADALIAGFEADVAELKKDFGEDAEVHVSLAYDYQVKTDNANVLAIDSYISYQSGSSNTVHSFYTVDKSTGKLLTLPGLFKENVDYISPISLYIKDEMERLNREENGLFWIGDDTMAEEAFDQLKPDQNFYINSDNQLVICFDKYEVSAGAQGSPEFVIPTELIQGILAVNFMQ